MPNQIKIDFLQGGFKKKTYKAINIFVLCLVVLNMSMMGVFFAAEPVIACHGNIFITKYTEPAESGQEFDFNASGPGFYSEDFSLTGSSTIALAYSSSGTYVISEDDVENWELVNIECDDKYNYEVDLENRELSIYVNGNGDMHCAFYNRISEPECGNGIQEPGEQCDDGNTENGDGCNNDCMIEAPICEELTTINFDGFPAGTVINSQYSYNGVLISAVNKNLSHPDLAVIFDSANPSGGDNDLSAPGSGLNNNSPQEKILVIPENDFDIDPADGLIDDPNDESAGGIFYIQFSEPTIVVSAGLLDVDTCESGGSIKTFDISDTQNSSHAIAPLGDNSYQNIQIEQADVARMEIDLVSSAALTELAFCSVPSLPVCGNEIEESGEECDLGGENGEVCQPEYGGSCEYCSEICEWETIPGPYCGDEIKNGEEECDNIDGVEEGQYCDAECRLHNIIYEPVYIYAQKVVCDSEEYLPNWGFPGLQSGEPGTIDSSTADEFVANSGGHCHIGEGWNFEWGWDGEAQKQPGDYIGYAPGGTGWQVFGSSTQGGLFTVAEINGDLNKIWVREVLPEGYIPFTNPAELDNGDSAEIYCHTDILNFDNYDSINLPEHGENYYCVAFNAPVPEPEIGTLIVKKQVSGGSAQPADWTMHIGEFISLPGSSVGTATSVEPGMYQITESGNMDNYMLSYSGDCSEEGYVSISAGETKTCILTNTYYETPPQIGILTVRKLVVGGSATSSDWEMYVGDTIHFPGSETGESRGLAPGMYQVTEDGEIDHYELSYSGDCGEAGHVTVAPEEDSECILTNTYIEPATSSIEVCKYIDSDGLASTTEDRFMSTSTDWTFSLDHGAEMIVKNTVNGCLKFDNLDAGNYILSEVLKENWQLLSPATNSVDIILGEGEDLNYDFINYYIDPPQEPVCGNNIVESGEECDDGPEGSTTCTSGCKIIETPPSDPVCGNNIREAGEECDGTDVDESFTCDSECIRHKKITGGGGGGWLIPPVKTVTSQEVEVQGEYGMPLLVIEKKVMQDFANAGDKNIPYIITIVNNGNLSAYNPVLTDNLPLGFKYSGTSSGYKIWNLDDIEPGKIIKLEYIVDIDEAVKSGIYTNTAVLNADNHNEIQAEAELEVREVEVLGVTLPQTGFSIEELIALLLLTLFLSYSAEQLRVLQANK